MRFLLAPMLSLSLASGALAQATLDPKSMLEGLQDIKTKAAQSAQAQLAQTISDFTAASGDDGSALAFYEEGIRVTQFVGQNREQTAFRDWRKKQEPNLNASAIRMALRYTTISLQRAAGATDDQIFPVLLYYAQEASSLLPAVEGQEIVHKPVSENLFARWYNIGPRLASLDNWEASPADVEGMYNTLILPVMRKHKDPRLLQYWDDKLANEKARASVATAAFSTDRFNQTRRPELLWSRAEDEIVLGYRDQGLNDMYNLVKAFPSHPDASKWVTELQGLLTPLVPGAAPAAAPAAAAVH